MFFIIKAKCFLYFIKLGGKCDGLPRHSLCSLLAMTGKRSWVLRTFQELREIWDRLPRKLCLLVGGRRGGVMLHTFQALRVMWDRLPRHSLCSLLAMTDGGGVMLHTFQALRVMWDGFPRHWRSSWVTDGVA